jgi:hypothetical protein
MGRGPGDLGIPTPRETREAVLGCGCGLPRSRGRPAADELEEPTFARDGTSRAAQASSTASRTCARPGHPRALWMPPPFAGADRGDGLRHRTGALQRPVLRKAAIHRPDGRRSRRRQHAEVHGRRDPPRGAGRLRDRSTPPEGRVVGGQGERPRDFQALARGRQRGGHRVRRGGTRAHARGPGRHGARAAPRRTST